jgi:PRTRC genetic system ThiF family protein
MNELNLDYVNAARLFLPAGERIGLALVGCGGTGSWLAPTVARVARLLREKFGKLVEVYFVDPDPVAAKNVYRQNFCDAEIGRNKATALAWRYGLAWGLEITAVEEAFDSKPNFGHGYKFDLEILIGCVDGAAGRQQIAEYAEEYGRRWWLDCGNFKAGGQVLLGGGLTDKDPLGLPGLCCWLPLPSVQHPEILQAEPKTIQPEEGLSCADLAMLDSQGLAINQRVAAEAGDYLVRMLLTKDLKKMATYMDLASGSSRSVYITAENCRKK